jgi:hypothetical protein
MSKTPLVLLIAAALVPAACAQAPGDAGPAERAQGRATAAAPGEGGFIESVEYRGTGCGGNSATTALSPDNQVATSTFSDFLASSGAGISPADASRNCLLMLKINVPGGWSYSLESVDIRGFADLPSGVTATRKSVYVISGSPIHSTPTARFKGQISNDYNDADVSPEKPGEWSPCGGGQLLWIATQTEIGGHGKDAAVLSIDSIDTELQWRRCQ